MRAASCAARARSSCSMSTLPRAPPAAEDGHIRSVMSLAGKTRPSAARPSKALSVYCVPSPSRGLSAKRPASRRNCRGWFCPAMLASTSAKATSRVLPVICASRTSNATLTVPCALRIPWAASQYGAKGARSMRGKSAAICPRQSRSRPACEASKARSKVPRTWMGSPQRSGGVACSSRSWLRDALRIRKRTSLKSNGGALRSASNQRSRPPSTCTLRWANNQSSTALSCWSGACTKKPATHMRPCGSRRTSRSAPRTLIRST